MRSLYYTLYCRGGSGLSNLVMSCELGVIAAHLLGRRLVLEGDISPPANVVRHEGVSNERPSRITDLIELPVPWVATEDTDIDPEEALTLGKGRVMDAVFVWPADRPLDTDDFRAFARGRREIVTETPASRAASVVRLFPSSENGHAMENLGFYSYFFYLDRASRAKVHALLRKMRAREPYRALAARIAEGLGSFNAVHVRRGDFKKTFGTTTLDRRPEEAIRVLSKSFGREQPLAILTDEREDPFFDGIVAHFRRSVFLDELILGPYREAFFALPQHDSIALAYVSQLVASHSVDFVGTMTSTFTSMIQRYRGNHGRTERFKFLWNELPGPDEPARERGSHPPSDCVPLHPDGRCVERGTGPYSWNRIYELLNPAWQREWPESFLSVGDDPDTLHASDTAERPQPLAEARMATTPVDVTIHLLGGQSFRTMLEADSEPLRALFEAAASPRSGTPRLLQIPCDGGHRAFTFSSEQLVAVETTPPVLVDLPAPSASPGASPRRSASSDASPRPSVEEQHSEPEQAPRARRAPPSVQREPYPPLRNFPDAPCIASPHFLNPSELSRMVTAASAAEPRFAPLPSWPHRDVCESFDPAMARVLTERLRLVLPQLLPQYDPARPLSAERFEFCAHRDGDELKVGAAPAASGDAITCSYFFHAPDVRFTGGTLCLSRDGADHEVEPRNNVLVVHPTAALQSIRPLRLEGTEFSDRLFSATLRIG